VHANSWLKKNFLGIFRLQAGERRLVSTADFNHTRRPVSQDHSRKQFLAKFIGLIAAAGPVPKLLGRVPGVPAAQAAPSARWQVKTEARAVARRADSA
jgi:hypothetical protein